MDLSKTTHSLTISNSRPISPSPVRETTVAAPATVEEGTGGTKRQRGGPQVYERDAQGKFTSQASIEKKRLLMSCRGDMAFEGQDFTPHILTVNKGENIIKRIMSFTQDGTRAITVLSANGQVANVKIQKLGLSGQVTSFKGAYDIISLRCSLKISETTRGTKIKTEWVITISVADGNIVGGTLADKLIAASPVQVVVGSFWPLVPYRPQKRNAESQAELVPTAIASSSAQPVEQPEMTGSMPFLTLGWYGSEPELKK